MDGIGSVSEVIHIDCFPQREEEENVINPVGRCWTAGEQVTSLHNDLFSRLHWLHARGWDFDAWS